MSLRVAVIFENEDARESNRSEQAAFLSIPGPSNDTFAGLRGVLVYLWMGSGFLRPYCGQPRNPFIGKQYT